MTDESLKEEILINVTPSEVRAALLESGILQEVYIERSARRLWVDDAAYAERLYELRRD